MTPARAITLIVLILVPAGLWGYVNTLRSDLATRTRAVLWQAQHGTEASRARFFSRYRDPAGDPETQRERFDRLWLTLRDLRQSSVAYGTGGTMTGSDGQSHDHRQVLIKGKDSDGKPLTLSLEWVRCQSGWRILDYH